MTSYKLKQQLLLRRTAAWLLCALFCSGTCFSHAQQTVDFKSIKQKKIRKIIKVNQLDRSENYVNVRSRCLCEGDQQYNVHKKSFRFDFPVDEVWDTYLEIPPKAAWNDKLTSFGMLYESSKGRFHYVNDASPKASVGQLVFINLHLLKGFVNIAVAHEIKEINRKQGLIRSCYLESGKSKGTQFIRFKATKDNGTVVEHTTYYKSGSHFRDKYLYPWLHEKIISEFHGNINHYLEIKAKDRKPQLVTN